MVFRPKRGKNRFEGEAAAQDEVTTLSAAMNQSKNSSADGTKLRRRWAMGIATCLVVAAILIGVLVSGGKNSGNSSDSSEYSTGGSGSVSHNPDEVPYEIPKSPSAAYELVESDIIEGMHSAVAVFKHTKSGMPVMAIIPKDPNQDATFGVNFRTPPEQTDGAQYVVQNAILSGSVNYPVKDPINQVKRGSLQSYWETWTNRDRTSFVVSSRNLADFHNNIKVMIDAIFHPLFVNPDHKWIYRQEAWRLETPDNQHMIINGNAFNEAKAAQMDPQRTMISEVYKNLFPDHIYSRDPKGEASEIVTLTYQEIVDYYNSYYHPANGQAYCYGKQQFIDTCLKELEPVLDGYEYNDGIRRHSQVEWQDMTELSSEIQPIGYPSWQDQIDYRSVVAWVLNDEPMDLRTELCWCLIYELLAGSSSASIPKAVVELNLGDDSVTFFDRSLQQWVMGLGVSGIRSEDKVEIARNSVQNVLKYIVNNGFTKESVDAALNKLDFRFREQSSADMPRGAKAFHEVLGHWNYDRDPFFPLRYSEAFRDLKAEISDHGQAPLLELITRRMFNSKHSTFLYLYPNKDFAEQWESMEINWLNNLNQYLTVDEGKELLKETATLKQRQATDDSDEALAKIPHLKVSDLSREVYTPPTVLDKDLFDSGVNVLRHELPFTNGIAYVDFVIDISNIDFDDIVLLPLFCGLLLEGGTPSLTGVQMQQEIDKYSGGISVYPLIDEIVETDADGNNYVIPNGKHFVTKIVVSGACIAEQTCLPMMNLFRHILWDSNVQNKVKARDLLAKMIDDMEDDIQNNGHKYTTLRIASRYSLNGFINEQWKGLTQLMQMRRALAVVQSDFTELGLRLVKMQDAMKRGNRNGMVMSVSGDKSSLKDVKGALELFFKDVLPLATQTQRFPDFAQAEHPWVPKGLHRMESEVDREQKNQAIIVPTRVNHVGKGGMLYDIGEPISGADTVVTSYLSGYYLYDQLRIRLGASHAGATLDVDSGVLIYQSDRDPNIEHTLTVYKGGADWLWKQMKEDDLPQEARTSIIGAIGKLDGSAMQPNRVGINSITHYLKQNNVEMRQRWREQILEATANDFKEMVERLSSWGQPSIVVVTSSETFEAIDQMDLPMSQCLFSEMEC
ncbi:peptidase M16C family-associated protein [Nitzschia inconspicua]|uniref:Peptidase M16C family-associated protein n=1 Tax=Nitzschia inconspicua TaxID=303405 RepID=A0A9K3Q1J2_9STRA|nr:peptidase M16C family-associated protein [Nitzschia inconspicua]